MYNRQVRISELLELVSKHGGYAGEKNEKPYVFIIDEINRGNISKIFGELITPVSYTHLDVYKRQVQADCMTKSVVRQKERLCL